MATKPVLLRPEECLVEAMDRAAAMYGQSRQQFMLQVLEERVTILGLMRDDAAGPADVPLPGT
jgi:hypothetical protein